MRLSSECPFFESFTCLVGCRSPLEATRCHPPRQRRFPFEGSKRLLDRTGVGVAAGGSHIVLGGLGPPGNHQEQRAQSRRPPSRPPPRLRPAKDPRSRPGWSSSHVVFLIGQHSVGQRRRPYLDKTPLQLFKISTGLTSCFSARSRKCLREFLLRAKVSSIVDS